jgi:hypothetical protein
MDEGQDRLVSVSVRPGSPAQHAYHARESPACSPRPSRNLRFFGGKTIADLVFANHYLGGAAAWAPADRASIDAGLAKAMSDRGLLSVIQQYFDEPVSSRMLPSEVRPEPAPDAIYKDQVEALAAQIYRGGLDGADPGRTVVNIMLPRGVVLVNGFSPGFRPPPGQEAEHSRRLRAVVTVGGQDADSRHGLGGYHGSVHVTPGVTVYYAVGVYSEGGNGIPAFGQPWKDVVATFYHELNEARTDPDVEDAIRAGDRARLGWYSLPAGEIGDLPILAAGPAVFQDVDLADGSGTVPVQLMWSNHHSAPAPHLP